ncbi:hypothetical protein F5Y16DRAFT_411663 [Xylariaceae sp. FL0255]|nr:hypothetical protein F5Y16DRAFT_411663 [Xylariaceae sp. FL0255]
MPEHNLRILSLDGGGVRGLSSLIILKQLMAMINPEHPPKPCDYFDFIGGTSTGGIIAIMLGRLRMSIDECIDAYASLSDDVFQKRNHRFTLQGKIQGRFDKLALEKAVKLIWLSTGFTKTNYFAMGSTLHVNAVYAASKESGNVVCFTSYQALPINSHLFTSTKIWEACRATSAATSFFDPITIGPFKESFVDAAALGVNNPVYVVWNQAQEIWGSDQLSEDLNCLVSIGTGVPGVKPFKDDIFHISKTLAAIATETEKTAASFRLDKSLLVDAGLYYRFNVTKGLETVGLQESAKKADIAAATLQYIVSQEVLRQFKACVSRMSEMRKPEKETPGKYQDEYSLLGVPMTYNYVGRPTDTAEMEQVFSSDRTSADRVVFVLHGLGGMGKTQFAADFVRKHHTEFSKVFWLDGRTEETLRRSLVMCATTIQNNAIGEQSHEKLFNCEGSVDALIMRVMNWLSRPGNTSWLLVFDNVDKDHHGRDSEAYDVTHYFPSSNGSILITTRLSRLAQLGHSRRLDKVGDVQAYSIFEKWYGSKPDPESINQLLSKLDGLPLGLAQAAAYLRETGMGFACYLQYYEEQWRDLMEYQGTSTLCRADRNIATTWLISLRSIQAKNPAAINLLRIWAFLDNKSMFHELLGAAAKPTVKVFPEWLRLLATDKLKFIEATRVLLSHSMIERAQGESLCFLVHPTVHKCAAEVGITATERLELIDTAILLIGLVVPKRKSSDYWAVSRKLLPHAAACSHLLISARDRLVQPVEQNIEPNLIAVAAHGLADFNRTHGKLLLAYDLYKIALDRKTSTVGPKELWTLDTVNNLGVLCQGLSKFDEAESLHLQAMQGREQLLGPDHVATLGAVNNLALVYLSKNQLQDAKSLFERAFKGRQYTLGFDHPSTLRVLMNLGLVHTESGDLAKAEIILRQALKGYEIAVGRDHIYTFHAASSLGHVFEDQERLADAEEMSLRALTGYKNHIGLYHIWTLDTMDDLAEESFKLVLDISRKVLGLCHISTLESMLDLASLYLNDSPNRWKEAKGLLDETEMFLRTAQMLSEEALDLIEGKFFLLQEAFATHFSSSSSTARNSLEHGCYQSNLKSKLVSE